MAGASPWLAGCAPAGSAKRVTEFVLLCQYQAVRPFTIRSLSLIIPGTASRK